MIVRLFTVLLLLLSSGPAMLFAAADTGEVPGTPVTEPLAGPPLIPGEEFHFAVHWAIVPGAGEIAVQATRAPSGDLKVTTTTSTRRLARMLLPFRATADALYDARTGALKSLHERSQTRGKSAEHIVNFDYIRRRASYVIVGGMKPTMITIPAGSPTDLITALIQTRRWEMQPGDKRDVLVLFDDDFYELTIHALRYETITTHLGTFRTLVLQPRMDKTEPKGMFKRGSTVQVWIAQDERRLPVKFEVEFKIGTGTAVLERYTPGDSAVAAKKK